MYATTRETGKVVPTWNYATVDAWGRRRVTNDTTWLHRQLEDLTLSRERARSEPWRAEHARWIFDYDPEGLEDDEAGYRFGTHNFAPGEYVSIRGADGVMHTFAVASVSSVL
jgi:hypothetical protein